MSQSRSKGQPILGQAEIQQALLEVAEIAQRHAQPVLLIGGVALHYYGSDRLTSDIDIVAQADLPAELHAKRPLSFGGQQTTTPKGHPLDWIARNDDYAELFDEALKYGRRVPDLPVPIASPEYLAAMKMVAGRPKDEQDLLMLIQSGELSIPSARKLIKRLLGAYAADTFDGYVREARWLAKEAKR